MENTKLRLIASTFCTARPSQHFERENCTGQPELGSPLVRSLRPPRVPSSQVAHEAAASPASGYCAAGRFLRRNEESSRFLKLKLGVEWPSEPFAALLSEARHPELVYNSKFVHYKRPPSVATREHLTLC